MKPFKITMLGPTGVGKTSLLASMFDHFDKLEITKITITPDDASFSKIKEYCQELRKITEFKEFIVKDALSATGDKRTFTFDVAVSGKKPSIKLQFQDYPGGYLIPKPENSKNFDEVKKYIDESDVVIIAIDSVALMEPYQDDNGWIGKYHDEINEPRIILQLFRSVIQDLSTEKLVIFAPLKCETYLRENNDYSEDLINRIKNEYESLLNFFSSELLSKKVAVIITPIQTLGCVIFSAFKLEKNERGVVEVKYIFINTNNKYEPKDAEQPLRYILSFLLKKYKKSFLEKVAAILTYSKDSTLSIIFDEDFRAAAKEVAAKAKENNLFVILQGKELLK